MLGEGIIGDAALGDRAPVARWKNDWVSKGPGFILGDLVMTQRRDFNPDGLGFLIYRIYGEVVRIAVDLVTGDEYAEIFVTEGDQYLDGFNNEIEWVAIGNREDPTRSNLIYMTADEEFSPRLDLRSGVTSVADFGAMATLRATLGNLGGITDANFGALSGYGLFTENAYLKGTIAGGAASALMTGAGYYANKAGDFRFGNPSTNKYIKFDVVTGIVDIGSGVALQWASVTGAGKPADNATVGADWSTNVTGRPTNLVALGDIPGFIQSTYINSTEIKAPNITGNSILGGNIVASSGGTNTAGLTGETSGETSVRIWAGSTYANRASAPFRVTQDGKVVMTNATVQSANSGQRIVISSVDNAILVYSSSDLTGYLSGSAIYGISLRAASLLGVTLQTDGGFLFLNNDGSVSITVSSIAPLNIASTVVCTNLNANYLQGNLASAFAAASHNHAASAIVSGTLADARIAASSVVQHQASLSIAQSQITGAWGSGGSGTLWVSSNGSSFVGVGIGTINITIGGTTHNLLRAF